MLQHLDDPQAGLTALAGFLDEEGGIGLMVYAPLGRAGVYPLQGALRTLLAGLEPRQKLKRARAILRAVPDAHPFKRNARLVDHDQGDAGFFDLL